MTVGRALEVEVLAESLANILKDALEDHKWRPFEVWLDPYLEFLLRANHPLTSVRNSATLLASASILDESVGLNNTLGGVGREKSPYLSARPCHFSFFFFQITQLPS